MASVWGELKRRNVVKVAVAYAVVGWLLIEVASTVFPIVQLPNWTVTLVAMLLILGFPVALILSWAYEVTPDAMKRSNEVPPTHSITNVTGRRLDFVIISVLVLAVGFMFVDNYLPESALFVGADTNPASRGSELGETQDITSGNFDAPSDSIVQEEQRDVLPNSVAVLPFENLSPDPENGYFAAGIHESIISQLARLRNLSVIARTSVMQFEGVRRSISEIANELRVESVMEGSVRYAGDRVLVTAQLIDGETGAHLWVDEYEGSLSDVFGIQSDIAMNIANALEAEFSVSEQESIEKKPTQSEAAYALYLRALTSPSAVADTYLDQAIAVDSQFALAFATRAYWNAERIEGASAEPTEVAALMARVREDAERALALDSTIGIAYSALANLNNVTGNLAEAQNAYERALDLSPNDPHVIALYSRFKRYIGEYDEAIRLSERSVELSPNDGFANLQLAFHYWYTHNYAAAVETFRKCIDLDASSTTAYLGVAFAEISRGNYDTGLLELQIGEQLIQGDLASTRLGQFAFAYAQMGRSEDASRYFSTLQERAQQATVAEAVLAMANFAVGNYEEAYLHLQNAVNNPQPGEQIALSELKANAYGDPMLEEPRWLELRDRIGALD